MEKVLMGIKNSKLVEWINTKTGKKIMGTVLLSGIGVALPRIFHVLAGASAGATYLPMHIAVLIAALTFGVISGSFVAGISIIFNYLLTGMPNLVRLPYMLIELVIYAVLLGVFNKKLNSYISLILSLVIGRIVYAGILFISGSILGFNLTGISNVIEAVKVGIPGILIQLAFVPFISSSIKKGIKLND